MLPALFLSACGMLEPFGFKDRRNDYLYAVTLPPIDAPTDLNVEELYELYPIPDIENGSQDRQLKFAAPEPLRNPSVNDVRIQKMGRRSWLIVSAPPAELWPRLRGFISYSKLAAARSEPRNGLLETRWLQIRQGESRERYRFQILPGLQLNTAEVHILQDAEDRRVGWPPEDDDAKRALGMLEVFASYLVEQSQAAGLASLRASSMENKPRMQRGLNAQGQKALLLEIPFARTWGAIEVALRKGDFLILDKNREGGIYYVAYDPEKKVNTELALGEAALTEMATREELLILEVHVVAEAATVAVSVHGAGVANERREELLDIIADHIS